MKFLSKAETLKSFHSKFAKIPKSFNFYTKDFFKNETKLLKLIKKKFNKKIIVRSSFYGEDTKKSSNAGKYKSIPDLDPKDNELIKKSIYEVIKSKRKRKLKDQILIQEYVSNAKISGVATSCCLQNYSPYININYTKGASTSLVTSGRTNANKIQIFYKQKKHKFKKFKKIVFLIKEIVKKYNNKFIEIEFAIDASNKIYLFQIRPIVITKSKLKNFNYIGPSLKKLEKKIKKLQIPNYDIIGKTTYFGVMPDWNPAEIIGKKPKPLALSLYQELITDHVWSKNRKDYGFKDIQSHHLMTSFLGTPYIDTRVDFNSWLPSNLNKNLSNKLINHYLSELKKKPNIHDKLEFELLFTCSTPTNEKRIDKLKNKITKKEIKKIKSELIRINKKAYQEFNKNLKMIKILEHKQAQIYKSNMYHIDKIYWLVEDCKNYGTYPFAGLARCAFIAMDVLHSLEKEKYITLEQKKIFLSSLQTVATTMQKDFVKLSKIKFLKKYGHIRPSTYDINSNNYRDSFKTYFSSSKNWTKKNTPKLKLKLKQKNKLKKFINKCFGKISIENLFAFMKSAIEAREYAKFIFTKNIDSIFEKIKLVGKKNNILIDDLAYLKIIDLLGLHYNLETNVKNTLIQNIKNNKAEYNKTSIINLPDIIYSPDDIYAFEELGSKPNFITNKASSAEIFELKELNNFNIKNKIVLIENADPGYDFIFSHKIKGLVTMYGGANSHMAIRCAELNIPAAIGVGESKFLELSKNKKIFLDCETQLINGLQ